MSDIKQRLALRAEITKRRADTGVPEAMKVIWALEAGSASEMNAQIGFLSQRSAGLFKLPLDQATLELLAQSISPKSIPTLLEGLTELLEAGNADDINLNTLAFLVPALTALNVDYSENMRPLLKGRLYHALGKVMPLEEAHATYEAFALKQVPEFHCTVFNSHYDATLEKLATSTPITEEGRQHLANIARSEHFDYYAAESEVIRWVPQFEHLNKLRKSAQGSDIPLLDDLISKRASHLAQWLSDHPAGVALPPFSGVKSITSNTHAHRVLDTCIMIASCVNQLPDTSPEARVCANALLGKLVIGLTRYSASLGPSKWQKLEDQLAEKADWSMLMQTIPAKNRAVIAKNFRRIDLFGDHLGERELSDTFERELGL